MTFQLLALTALLLATSRVSAKTVTVTSPPVGLEREWKPKISSLEAGDDLLVDGRLYELGSSIGSGTGGLLFRIRNSPNKIIKIQRNGSVWNPNNMDSDLVFASAYKSYEYLRTIDLFGLKIFESYPMVMVTEFVDGPTFEDLVIQEQSGERDLRDVVRIVGILSHSLNQMYHARLTSRELLTRNIMFDGTKWHFIDPGFISPVDNIFYEQVWQQFAPSTSRTRAVYNMYRYLYETEKLTKLDDVETIVTEIITSDATEDTFTNLVRFAAGFNLPTKYNGLRNYLAMKRGWVEPGRGNEEVRKACKLYGLTTSAVRNFLLLRPSLDALDMALATIPFIDDTHDKIREMLYSRGLSLVKNASEFMKLYTHRYLIAGKYLPLPSTEEASIFALLKPTEDESREFSRWVLTGNRGDEKSVCSVLQLAF